MDNNITKTHDQVHDLVYMLKTNKSILEQDIRDYGDNITWINVLIREETSIASAWCTATDEEVPPGAGETERTAKIIELNLID